MNKVFLIGHLGHDPNLRQTDHGKAVANFSVATDEKVKRGAGFEKVTTWHKIIEWEKQVENFSF